jgi:hypothetical protein
MTATVFMWSSSGTTVCDGTAWQFSFDLCPSCHSWLDYVKRSVTAMLMIIVFAALAAYGIGAAVVALRNDGYHRLPFDPRRA